MNGWIDIAVYSCIEVFTDFFNEEKYRKWAESNYKAASSWYGYYLMAQHYNKKTDVQAFYDCWCKNIAMEKDPNYSAGILETDFEIFWSKIKPLIKNDTY